MSERITVRFKSYFKQPLLDGTKVYTSRTSRMGKPGDTFEAFGALFELLSVQDVSLYEVSTYWKEEGCTSREHFIDVWNEIHPRKRYDDYQRVYLHHFKLITAPDPARGGEGCSTLPVMVENDALKQRITALEAERASAYKQGVEDAHRCEQRHATIGSLETRLATARTALEAIAACECTNTCGPCKPPVICPTCRAKRALTDAGAGG